MKKTKILNWIARILAIVYILFISMFALDVFSEGEVFWYQELLAFFVHLIPSFILIGSLILAWKKKFIGSIICLSLIIVFILWFDLYESWQGFLLIGLPLLLIGSFFLTSHFLNKKYATKIKENKKSDN